MTVHYSNYLELATTFLFIRNLFLSSLGSFSTKFLFFTTMLSSKHVCGWPPLFDIAGNKSFSSPGYIEPNLLVYYDETKAHLCLSTEAGSQSDGKIDEIQHCCGTRQYCGYVIWTEMYLNEKGNNVIPVAMLVLLQERISYFIIIFCPESTTWGWFVPTAEWYPARRSNSNNCNALSPVIGSEWVRMKPRFPYKLMALDKWTVWFQYKASVSLSIIRVLLAKLTSFGPAHTCCQWTILIPVWLAMGKSSLSDHWYGVEPQFQLNSRKISLKVGKINRNQ